MDHEDFKLMTESLIDVFWMMSGDLHLMYISPAIEKLTGFTQEEAMSTPMEGRYTPATILKIKELYDIRSELTPGGGQHFTLEVELYRKDGTTVWCESRFHLVWDDTRVIKIFGSTNDITHRKQAEMELVKLAVTDHMTGSYNKQYFQDMATYEIARSKRYKRDLSIIVFDIDHFKSINDTYGHLIGDEAIRSIGKIISPFLRKTDLFGRLGGEEFGLLLPETPLEGSILFANRIRMSIEQNRIPTLNSELGFTISAGCASLHPGDSSVEALLSRADCALYKAKRAGRNRVSY